MAITEKIFKDYRIEVSCDSYVDWLAKNGFVVFKIDLRGHDHVGIFCFV